MNYIYNLGIRFSFLFDKFNNTKRRISSRNRIIKIYKKVFIIYKDNLKDFFEGFNNAPKILLKTEISKDFKENYVWRYQSGFFRSRYDLMGSSEGAVGDA